MHRVQNLCNSRYVFEPMLFMCVSLLVKSSCFASYFSNLSLGSMCVITLKSCIVITLYNHYIYKRHHHFLKTLLNKIVIIIITCITCAYLIQSLRSRISLSVRDAFKLSCCQNIVIIFKVVVDCLRTRSVFIQKQRHVQGDVKKKDQNAKQSLFRELLSSAKDLLPSIDLPRPNLNFSFSFFKKNKRLPASMQQFSACSNLDPGPGVPSRTDVGPPPYDAGQDPPRLMKRISSTPVLHHYDSDPPPYDDAGYISCVPEESRRRCSSIIYVFSSIPIIQVPPGSLVII